MTRLTEVDTVPLLLKRTTPLTLDVLTSVITTVTSSPAWVPPTFTGVAVTTGLY